jgi:hypothetical protein
MISEIIIPTRLQATMVFLFRFKKNTRIPAALVEIDRFEPSDDILMKKALPDLLGLLYHVDQQLENRLSLKPHLDAVDNDI